MAALAGLLGQSEAVAALRDKVDRLIRQHAASRRFPPILIQGETGTGKGLLARALHQSSPRHDGPFVDINCAAIPETLLEAELFGFERGAFTDARQPKPGLFQAANRGTLFLDELGLLPRALQGKLLTVVEERAVRRLGSTRTETVDLWIIGATSDDLLGAVRDGHFHEALYHRLSVLTLWLPPLRERGDDIALLAEHFLARACADHHLPPKTLAPDAQAALRAYHWPGNVRELINVMERVALLFEGPRAGADALALSAAPAPRDGTRVLRDMERSAERERLAAALAETNWVVTHAAARLGIPPNTLRYRMKKHGLGNEAPPSAAHVADQPLTSVESADEALWSASVRWTDRWLALLGAALVSPTQHLDLSRAITMLARKVSSFGGRVEELSPGAITAAFGLDPVEDPARQAAHVALAMVKALERARAQDGAQWQIKVGIHVIHAAIGATDGRLFIDAYAKRQAATTLGDLTDDAEPGTVHVSEAAARFLGRQFDLTCVDHGESAREPVYRLAGGERIGFGSPGRRTKFIGRSEEFGLLQRRLASAMRGRGQVVAIRGDAGIGKSRLLLEFKESLAAEPIVYAEGRCLSYASTIPYFAFVDILKRTCDIDEADPSDAHIAKVRRHLAEASMDQDEGTSYLLHVLGATEGTEASGPLAPEMLKARTFETLREVLLRGSRHRPAIIAVEDLHWIDPTSEQLLSSLVEHLAAAHVLLVVTYRSGYRPSWADRSYATEISLQALSPEESLAVIRSTIGDQQLPDALAGAIAERGEGNPFFLEELARATEAGSDAGKGAAIPDTIHGVLLARIERRPTEERHVLQCASVVGRDVRFALLRAIAATPDDSLRDVVSRLQAAELLYKVGGTAEADLTFKHALTHEVAYASLPEPRRRVLHAETLIAVERLYADRVSEWLEHLAHHARAGQLWERAAMYARRAGSKASARSAYPEAVAYFEQAVEALGHLPRTQTAIEEGIDVRLDLRTPLNVLGEFDKLHGCLRSALDLAEALGDPRRLAVVLDRTMALHWLEGQALRGIEFGRRAVAIAETQGDLDLWLATAGTLGISYYPLDYGQGIEWLGRVLDRLPDRLAHERFWGTASGSVLFRVYLVACLAERGDFPRALATAKDGLGLAEAVQHPFSIASACWAAGFAHLRGGHLAAAIRQLDRGLAVCREAGIAVWVPALTGGLGYAYALCGRTGEGRALLQEAVTRSLMNNRVSEALWHAWLGEVHLLRGEVSDAAAAAGRALALARERHYEGHEAWAIRLLGDIAADPEVADQCAAIGHYKGAIELASKLEMSPLIAHCHMGLGRLHRRSGERRTALDHLTTATTMFDRMGMRLWSEQAVTEQSGLR